MKDDSDSTTVDLFGEVVSIRTESPRRKAAKDSSATIELPGFVPPTKDDIEGSLNRTRQKIDVMVELVSGPEDVEVLVKLASSQARVCNELNRMRGNHAPAQVDVSDQRQGQKTREEYEAQFRAIGLDPMDIARKVLQ